MYFAIAYRTLAETPRHQYHDDVKVGKNKDKRILPTIEEYTNYMYDYYTMNKSVPIFQDKMRAMIDARRKVMAKIMEEKIKDERTNMSLSEKLFYGCLNIENNSRIKNIFTRNDRELDESIFMLMMIGNDIFKLIDVYEKEKDNEYRLLDKYRDLSAKLHETYESVARKIKQKNH